MLQNLSTNRLLWLATILLALLAATVGVINPGVYANLVRPNMIPGTVSQDVATIAVSLVALFYLVRLRGEDVGRQILLLGFMGYLWYAYGIWVIERMYNAFYLLYLAIFAFAFWSLAYGVASIRRELLPKVRLVKPLRVASAGWALINPLIFYPLWISQLLPLMRIGQQAEHFYSIYILDLAFVMPAFLILAVLTAKNRGLGLLLTPALFVKGFAMLFSVALGGLLAPLYRQPGDMGQVWFYLSLAGVFLVLTVLHLRGLRLDNRADAAPVEFHKDTH
ncbi:MAG: hypothetical protein ACM3UP_01815 [Methanocella sp.]